MQGLWLGSKGGQNFESPTDAQSKALLSCSKHIHNRDRRWLSCAIV